MNGNTYRSYNSDFNAVDKILQTFAFEFNVNLIINVNVNVMEQCYRFKIDYYQQEELRGASHRRTAAFHPRHNCNLNTHLSNMYNITTKNIFISLSFLISHLRYNLCLFKAVHRAHCRLTSDETVTKRLSIFL